MEVPEKKTVSESGVLKESVSLKPISPIRSNRSTERNKTTTTSPSPPPLDQDHFDTTADYAMDPDSLHASALLGLNNDLPAEHDSYRIKRNSFERYMNKQMSNDEYDSFMIAAKNLRHVDEEIVRQRSQDNPPLVTIRPAEETPKIPWVQLRSVNKEVLSPTQEKNHKSILSQIKLRAVPSRTKEEIDVAWGSKASDDVQFSSIKSKIEMFEKSRANKANAAAASVPMGRRTSSASSIVKSIHQNFQKQQTGTSSSSSNPNSPITSPYSKSTNNLRK